MFRPAVVSVDAHWNMAPLKTEVSTPLGNLAVASCRESVPTAAVVAAA